MPRPTPPEVHERMVSDPGSRAARDHLAIRLDRAVDGVPDAAAPVVVVDLDAFDANAADLERRAGSTPIRLASKSVRVPDLARRVLGRPGFQGVLAYTLREACWLVGEQVTDDAVVAYPTVDRSAIDRLLDDPRLLAGVTLMVDDPGHLDLVDRVRRGRTDQVRIALDVDAGLTVGGRHLGVKRSPLDQPAQVLDLARRVHDRPGFRLVGVMTYESQVAGVPDDDPGLQRARSLVVRRVKAASLTQLADRRARVAEALAELGPLEFWNGGGSGSVETTAADPVVTEVAAGSGLFGPTSFDHFRSFSPRPAAFFAVPVVRRPAPGVVTVAGGGFVASGPSGPSRSPVPWAPAGLRLTGVEGAGEVQTPLTGPGARRLRIGDRVWFRHAKAGELMEHTDRAHLVVGDRVVDAVPTYRGLGRVG